MTGCALLSGCLMSMVTHSTVRIGHMRIMGIHIICKCGLVGRGILLMTAETNVRSDCFRWGVLLMTASAFDASHIVFICQKQRLFHRGFRFRWLFDRFCYRSTRTQAIKYYNSAQRKEHAYLFHFLLLQGQIQEQRIQKSGIFDDLAESKTG